MATKNLSDKDKAIKKEMLRLKRILKDIDDNRKKSAEGLIQEAAFMRATLQELKQLVDENGPIDEMPQGDYTILREHPALKSYNTMIQRYNTVCKELINLLPKTERKVEDDGFDGFIESRTD